MERRQKIALYAAIKAGALSISLLESPASTTEISGSDDGETEMAVVLSTLLGKKRRAEGERRNRISEFVESVVPMYCLDDFRSHFRMNKQTIERIVQEIGQTEMWKECNSDLGRPRISLLKIVLLSVWTLANQVVFRDIGDRFDLSRGHAHREFALFCKLMCVLKQKFIKWPTGAEAARVLRMFRELRNEPFPRVIGCVDGCHIAVKAPNTDRASYYNRKGFHSVVLQGICDAELMFIDTFAGWPGSTNDARIWRNSPICRNITTEPNETMPNGSHILGDSAYPLSRHIIVPYRDNGHMTRKQKKFNKVLSSTRVTIEQAFGRMKGRFRRLKYLDMSNFSLVPKVIVCACILHNICILEGDEEDVEIIIDNMQGGDMVEGNADVNGALYRDNLANNMFPQM